MKAAVVHGANDIRLEEVPRPFPEPGDIVVRVRASGICATDIKTLLGQGLPKKLPTILGHEVAGEVSALGEGVKDFAAGDRVAVYPIAVCGECDYCTNERHNLCRHEFGLAHGIDGGFAEFVRIPRQILNVGGVVKIPADIPFELAALAEQLRAGLPTLRDIYQALCRPGRDPREDLPGPIFRRDVLKMEDLRPEMILPGVVRNVVDFGAFIDVGVKQDGLVHISEISEHYIKHPSEVLQVGEQVTVRVLDVDLKRQRIGLSLKGL